MPAVSDISVMLTAKDEAQWAYDRFICEHPQIQVEFLLKALLMNFNKVL